MSVIPCILFKLRWDVEIRVKRKAPELAVKRGLFLEAQRQGSLTFAS
jgi:hypothetical protein